MNVDVPHAGVRVGVGEEPPAAERVRLHFGPGEGATEPLEYRDVRKLRWHAGGALEIEATGPGGESVHKVFPPGRVVEVEILE